MKTNNLYTSKKKTHNTYIKMYNKVVGEPGDLSSFIPIKST